MIFEGIGALSIFAAGSDLRQEDDSSGSSSRFLHLPATALVKINQILASSDPEQAVMQMKAWGQTCVYMYHLSQSNEVRECTPLGEFEATPELMTILKRSVDAFSIDLSKGRFLTPREEEVREHAQQAQLIHEINDYFQNFINAFANCGNQSMVSFHQCCQASIRQFSAQCEGRPLQELQILTFFYETLLTKSVNLKPKVGDLISNSMGLPPYDKLMTSIKTQMHSFDRLFPNNRKKILQQSFDLKRMPFLQDQLKIAIEILLSQETVEQNLNQLILRNENRLESLKSDGQGGEVRGELPEAYLSYLNADRLYRLDLAAYEFACSHLNLTADLFGETAPVEIADEVLQAKKSYVERDDALKQYKAKLDEYNRIFQTLKQIDRDPISVKNRIALDYQKKAEFLRIFLLSEERALETLEPIFFPLPPTHDAIGMLSYVLDRESAILGSLPIESLTCEGMKKAIVLLDRSFPGKMNGVLTRICTRMQARQEELTRAIQTLNQPQVIKETTVQKQAEIIREDQILNDRLKTLWQAKGIDISGLIHGAYSDQLTKRSAFEVNFNRFWVQDWIPFINNNPEIPFETNVGGIFGDRMVLATRYVAITKAIQDLAQGVIPREIIRRFFLLEIQFHASATVHRRYQALSEERVTIKRKLKELQGIFEQVTEENTARENREKANFLEIFTSSPDIAAQRLEELINDSNRGSREDGHPQDQLLA